MNSDTRAAIKKLAEAVEVMARFLQDEPRAASEQYYAGRAALELLDELDEALTADS